MERLVKYRGFDEADARARIARQATRELRLETADFVIDNSGYGEIRNEMIDRDDPVRAVTFRSPDFAALGRALGCRGVTITDPAELTQAVREALAADVATVIHLIHRDPAASIVEGARA